MNTNQNKPSKLFSKVQQGFAHIPRQSLPRIHEFKLLEIIPNPDQPRKTFDDGGIRELANSIERQGQLQPILVKEIDSGNYLLVAGERRYRAHQLLGRETILGVITTGDPAEISLVENVQREDLKPLEEAEGYARLIEKFAYTQQDLAQAVGKARSTINEILRLNTLPQQIKDECRTSDTPIGKYVLLQVARLESIDEQLRLWKQIQASDLTVQATRQAKKTGSTAPKKTSQVQLLLKTCQKLKRQLNDTTCSDFTNPLEVGELLNLQNEINQLITNVTRPQGMDRLDDEDED